MEYKPEELKRVQEIEVEILQEIIRVCEEYKLQYWVAYGTLIGTLRHNGFIPWDDDIDIGMMREDYEKFIEVAPSALKKGYTLQHFKTDPKTPTYHAKVRKDGTQFVEWYTCICQVKIQSKDHRKFSHLKNNYCAGIQRFLFVIYVTGSIRHP